MARRGNPHHKPAGTPDGGQFGTVGEGSLIRPTPMENDIQSYLDNTVAGNRDPLYKRERERNMMKALYDGGYLPNRKFDGDAEETENFIRTITTEHASKEVWLNHKDYVENYVGVAKGYFTNDAFDLVVDGKRSADGSARKATELMEEFGWSKKEVRQILLNNLTADDFVNSGANDSRYEANKGTVVMVFAPKIEAVKKVDGKMEKETVNLYVKMVLNPHPDRSRKQTEMQVLSFREAGNKVCLFTGEERNER